MFDHIKRFNGIANSQRVTPFEKMSDEKPLNTWGNIGKVFFVVLYSGGGMFSFFFECGDVMKNVSSLARTANPTLDARQYSPVGHRLLHWSP